MAQLNHRIGGRRENLREMLLSAGIGEFNATMSIPYMMMMPRTCDPWTQGIIQLVEGLQNLLNARGARIIVDGWLGHDTGAALARFAGPNWQDKTWMQLYGDVIRGRTVPSSSPAAVGEYHGGYVAETGLEGIVDAVVTNPLAWLAAGAAAFVITQRRRRANPSRRARR
jgi:hypothetical protein